MLPRPSGLCSRTKRKTLPENAEPLHLKQTPEETPEADPAATLNRRPRSDRRLRRLVVPYITNCVRPCLVETSIDWVFLQRCKRKRYHGSIHQSRREGAIVLDFLPRSTQSRIQNLRPYPFRSNQATSAFGGRRRSNRYGEMFPHIAWGV